MVLDELGRAIGIAKSFARSGGAIKKAPERKRLGPCVKATYQIKNCFSSSSRSCSSLRRHGPPVPDQGRGSDRTPRSMRHDQISTCLAIGLPQVRTSRRRAAVGSWPGLIHSKFFAIIRKSARYRPESLVGRIFRLKLAWRLPC